MAKYRGELERAIGEAEEALETRYAEAQCVASPANNGLANALANSRGVAAVPAGDGWASFSQILLIGE